MRISLIILVFLAGCAAREEHQKLAQGVWRGVISLQGQELPFNFAIQEDSTGSYKAFIKNADENLLLDEILYDGDSLVFMLHIFDAELRVKQEKDSLKGFFIKTVETDYRLPFRAAYDQSFRFTEKGEPAFDVSGKWSVNFVAPDAKVTPAVGIFRQIGDQITGTFLTTTGDYRYLEGAVAGDTLRMSAFDGNHAYLFKAVLKNDTLRGEYWSGKTSYKTWTGVRNTAAALQDPESITYLKEGYKKIAFSFPDLNKKMVSPGDEKYQDKVLILQLFGTWCPNCMDETQFLSDWRKENRDKEVNIIGLAYESKDDFDYAVRRVKKMAERFHIDYDLVIAGTKDKDEAIKTLPMLTKIAAFPTMIFIGRDGEVKKIHTGFSGPGTGVYYDEFIQYFNETVQTLLAEAPAEKKSI